jgi:hypothetical protein
MMQNTKSLQYWDINDQELETNVPEDETMRLNSNWDRMLDDEMCSEKFSEAEYDGSSLGNLGGLWKQIKCIWDI